MKISSGGTWGAVAQQIDQLLFLRPAFPYFGYRTPVRNLYLASASCNPAPAFMEPVVGMPPRRHFEMRGINAARGW